MAIDMYLLSLTHKYTTYCLTTFLFTSDYYFTPKHLTFVLLIIIDQNKHQQQYNGSGTDTNSIIEILPFFDSIVPSTSHHRNQTTEVTLAAVLHIV